MWSCVLSDAWFWDLKNLILKSRNQILGKLLLFRKLHHFRGSRFSQCFILSTSPYYSLPGRFYANNNFEYLPTVSTAFNMNLLNECNPCFYLWVKDLVFITIPGISSIFILQRAPPLENLFDRKIIKGHQGQPGATESHVIRWTTCICEIYKNSFSLMGENHRNWTQIALDTNTSYY